MEEKEKQDKAKRRGNARDEVREGLDQKIEKSHNIQLGNTTKKRPKSRWKDSVARNTREKNLVVQDAKDRRR